MADYDELFRLTLNHQQGEEVLNTLDQYSRWELRAWQKYFDLLAGLTPLPLTLHFAFIQDVVSAKLKHKNELALILDPWEQVEEPADNTIWEFLRY
ncbi:hypothetical protein R1flu_007785 [Riccia fluitans]|uniref:Uncharacterized protein n=1 Tax=Riccia fluitans TaxID=41844 RepID=A0ABD1Z0D4_9MARC